MPYRRVIEERLRFLEVDQTTVGSLRRIKQLLNTEVDDLLDKFYVHILQEPKLQSLFPDKETVARAREAQKRYWLDYLFSKTYDLRHFEQAEQIAQAHLRVGLEPSWYMGGYCYMLNQIVELACSCHEDDREAISGEIQALNKLVFLDMDTVIDRYIEAKNAGMRELLRRSTIFAEDITALSKELEKAQQDLQVKIDSAADGAEITECAAQLSTRVGDLTARLEKFQFGDRLSTMHHRKDQGFTARIQRFIDKHF